MKQGPMLSPLQEKGAKRRRKGLCAKSILLVREVPLLCVSVGLGWRVRCGVSALSV